MVSLALIGGLGGGFPSGSTTPSANDGWEINVKDSAYGAKGNGTTDDTAAIAAAIAAAGSNDTILFPPGTYLCSGVTSTGKSLRLLGYGAIIKLTANARILDLKGGFGTIYTVSSFTNTTYDFTSPSESVTTPVTKLTLSSSGHGYVQGDKLKIVSDDEFSGHRTASGGTHDYCGEVVEVGAVSGADVYLTALLREPIITAAAYTTTPRVAKYSGYKCEIEGLSFTADQAGDAANWNSRPFVELSAFIDSRIHNCSAYDGFDAAFSLKGCVGTTITHVHVKNMRNDPNGSRYGYGIHDIASHGTSISNCYFTLCRSGISTDAWRTAAANTSLEVYGRDSFMTATNCHSHGNTHMGFGLHGDTWMSSYIGCTATGVLRNYSSAGTGFGTRGWHNKLIGCRAYNCKYGILSEDEYPSQFHDILIEGCVVENAGENAFRCAKISSGDVCHRVTINNCSFHATGPRIADIQDYDIIDFNNCTFRAGGTTSGQIAISYQDGITNIRNCIVEMDDYGSNAFKVFKNQDATTPGTLLVDGLSIRNGTVNYQYLLDSIGSATHQPRLKRVTEVQASTGGFSSGANVADYYLSYVRGTDSPSLTTRSNYLAQTFGANDDPTIGHLFDDHITLIATVTGADRTLAGTSGVMPTGAFIGQRLTVMVAAASSFNLVIPSIATCVVTNINDRVLRPGDSINLTWTGTAWVSHQRMRRVNFGTTTQYTTPGSDVTEKTAWSGTIPAGHNLAAGCAIKIRALFSCVNSGNNKRFRFYLGGTAFEDITQTTITGTYIEKVIKLRTTSSQVCHAQNSSSGTGTTTSTQPQTAAVDMTGAITFSVSVQAVNVADTASLEWADIELEYA